MFLNPSTSTSVPTSAFIASGLTVLNAHERREFEKFKAKRESFSVHNCKPLPKTRKGTWKAVKDQVLANVKPNKKEKAKYAKIILDAKKRYGYPESSW